MSTGGTGSGPSTVRIQSTSTAAASSFSRAPAAATRPTAERAPHALHPTHVPGSPDTSGAIPQSGAERHGGRAPVSLPGGVRAAATAVSASAAKRTGGATHARHARGLAGAVTATFNHHGSKDAVEFSGNSCFIYSACNKLASITMLITSSFVLFWSKTCTIILEVRLNSFSYFAPVVK